MSAEIELKCNVCNERLDGEFEKGYGVLSVVPCESCIERNRIEADSEGYQRRKDEE